MILGRVRNLVHLRTLERQSAAEGEMEREAAACDALNQEFRALLDCGILLACFEDADLRERCRHYW
jgi:hypothetical protein